MTEPINLLEPLNEREQEIIECLVDRLSNREIADKLFLAASTVKWYIRQLNQKLDTGNRSEIVERVQELGLLEAEAPQESYFRPRENLPRQTTPFVGRDSELDELHAIIEKEDIRLLTILAPGGMGKTRIALEATEQQINRFPDGVYFVPLQALSEPEQIIPQIASSTFFSFQSDNRSQKQQLLDFLSNKTMLLCIDNWEHLLDGALLLNEVLATAPDVKIIATSREKLNLLAETVYVLQGMQFPEWETPNDALRYDAVQLLMQSAQRVKPNWDITEDNLDYVARVCRLTQGMPLGILLASSWLDVYSLERICEEIQKSADILETDMRDVPERQRSIRAIFDYSWEGLKPQEQDVLMKMSVFRGGCSPEAAEAVTGASPRILQSLVNKALLLRNKDGRYDLHELLRQYAEEKLELATVIYQTKDAHSHYFLEHLSGLNNDFKGRDQPGAFAWFESNTENIKLAWAWAVSERKFDLIDGTVESVLLYYEGHTNSREDGYRLFELARDGLEPQTDEEAHPTYGKVLSKSNINDRVQIELALEIAKKNNDLFETSYCLSRLAYIYLFQNQESMTLSLVEDCLTTIRRCSDNFTLGRMLTSLGLCVMRYGRHSQAQLYAEEALGLAQQVNDTMIFRSLIYNLMWFIALINGNFDKAEEAIDEALKLSHGRNLFHFAFHMHAKAFLLFQSGQLDIIQNIANKTSAIGQELSDRTTVGYSKILSVMVANANENYAQGLELGIFGFDYTHSHAEHKFLAWFPAMAASGLGKHKLAWSYGVIALQYGLQGKHEYYLSMLLSVPAFLIAREGHLIRATELASIVYDRPTSIRGYWDIDPQFKQLMETLQTELDEDTFNTAWERGKSLDVIQVIEELLDEFGGNQP